MRRTIIANWKMNLTLPEAIALAQGSARIAEQSKGLTVVIAPPSLWLVPVRESLRITPPHFSLASQAVSAWPEGAYTGDISARQLKGLVRYCLVGHSERRQYHHETGATVAAQVKQLRAQRITPVVCFGEMSRATQQMLSSQVTIDLKSDLAGLTPEDIEHCLFAYEPLWAIGTGNPASPDYVARAVEHVKTWLRQSYGIAPKILYGGSVTEANAGALGALRELDGLLVGGASLQVKRFGQICSDFSSVV